MNLNRSLVAFILTFATISCFYFDYYNVLYFFVNAAVIYDVWYLSQIYNISMNICLYLLIFMLNVNHWMYIFYNNNKYLLIKIIAITQLSDVFQYLGGKYYGKTKIGWISKNKTYEGYYIGWILTTITFITFYCNIEQYNRFKCESVLEEFIEVTAIYLMGLIGGLLSSLLKRTVNIKDYSNLLGNHGGWIDRIDSIVIPIIYYTL